MAWREVTLALGSNVGDSPAILQGAVRDLQDVPGLRLTGVSRVVDTDPVGGPEQAGYLKTVVVGCTCLDGEELLAATQAIEVAWHRTRETHWGPRTLDIDVITIGDERIVTDALVVPHPLAHQRAFVLVPWSDVAPGGRIVGVGTVADLVAAIDTAGVRPSDVVLHLAQSTDPEARP
jgi:2-amino-4-hydroxy-6-hydroxymethyldihydropteridine diphosphokinase